MNIAEYRAERRRAFLNGDLALVAEIDEALARLGYSEGELETAVPQTMEHAVPVKRGPGRPRKIPVKE